MDENTDPTKESDLTSEELYASLQNMVQSKEDRDTASKEHIRTYESDVAQQVKGKNMSVIQIALAEQKRQDQYVATIKKSKTQRIVYVLFACVALGGAFALIVWSLSYRESTVPIPSANAPRANALVFSEQQKPLDTTNLSRTEFLQQITREVSFVTLSGITNIIPVTYASNPPRALSGEEFISRFALNVPQTLPAMFRDDYMLGYAQNLDDMFVVFKFNDFDEVLNAMREWEDFLVQDFVTLMRLGPFTNADLVSRDFESEVVLNKISRTLRDDAGQTIMLYTFIDRNHLVIATKEQTVQEILSRFSVQSIR